MTKEELKALCNLLMLADPFPLSNQEKNLLENVANKHAIEHGFNDWIEALHGIQ